MKKSGGILLILILIIAAFVGGLLFENPFKTLALREDVLATAANCPFSYINQLRCEPDTTVKKKEYISLRNDLLDYIAEKKDSGKASFISVYFRDLQNGPTLGIDGQENFIPASLLKVPLMITYLKKAESDPKLLDRKVKAAGNIESLSQNITPQRAVTKGMEYTIEELIDLLVTQSDNTAWKMLLTDLRANYSEEDFIETLSDLGIIDPRKRNDQQYITSQNYASIFRILYNSSYLSAEMSDKALEMLTDSAFNDGLEAGVPDNVQIGHKFGEQLNASTHEQQLHDCGIVYYAPNPYVICVMTKGKDIKELSTIIADVSRKIYDEVDDRN